MAFCEVRRQADGYVWRHYDGHSDEPGAVLESGGPFATLDELQVDLFDIPLTIAFLNDDGTYGPLPLA